ncbi:MAG: glycosyltransferase 61 family protein [Alphaproteobacteria bacterium]|nr:glycosyltransferase 61 family protein [Alphaproteobacteria bacterium]
MTYTLYGSAGYNRFFKKSVAKQYVKDCAAVDCVPKGIIANTFPKKGFGIFTSDKEFVTSSLQMRNGRGQLPPDISEVINIPYVDQDVVYLGNVYDVFGHFILGHLNRSHALFNLPHDVKCVLINYKNLQKIPEYMFKFIELLGVKRQDIIILDKTTQFRNVYIASQGFCIPEYTSKEFAQIFDRMAANVPSPDVIYDKIYLSRTKMGARKTYGEEQIEKIFAKNGYCVLHPETMSLPEQIGLIKNCNVLAGCGGSALHMSLFMTGGTVINLRRNRKYKSNANIQHLINMTKNLKSVIVDASIEKVKTRHGGDVPQIIGITKHLQRFFDDFGIKYSDKDIQFDKSLYQEYLDALHEYKAKNGNILGNKLKRTCRKFLCLFVIGRARRSRVRAHLKQVFGA